MYENASATTFSRATDSSARWARGARVLSLVLVLSANGCERLDASKASLLASGSSSARPVQSSAPPPAPKPVPARLLLRVEPVDAEGVVGRAPPRPRQRVLITSPELAIDEPVTELAFPNTCQAFEPEGDRPWHVSCTPAYRKSLVEAAERAGELVLRFFSEHGEAREKRVPLGHERTFEPVASEVSSRAVACDPAVAPTRNVSVTLPSANWCCGYTPASILYLAVPGSPPLPLIDKDGWWQGCKAKDQGGAIEIQCPKQRHHAKIAVEGASLRFEWQDEHRNSGRVLLPCDVRATLIRPESFSGGNMYR